LENCGVGQSTISKFIEALDECEFERYAPGDAKGNMNKTFESAMMAIMDIENAMKNRSRKSSTFVILVMALFMPTITSAVTKENADMEYLKGNYQQAIVDYEELLKDGVSADLYFNLGNAYFRTDNITRAILNYERAHLLAPGDEDIMFNLKFARSKTIDKVTPQPEIFFVNWYRALVNFTSVDRWALAAIASIILVLVLLMLYLFADELLFRKIGFYGAIAFLLLFIFSNLFAYQQKSLLENRTMAIVVASSVNVKKTPADNSEASFVIHEGTKVDITDVSIKGWKEVKTEDGRQGWLNDNAIEEI
jgi:tetratricopeptide (TPR) repeat protein